MAKAITFIVNGTTYHISAEDTEAMANIAAADRGALVELLEALKQQDQVSTLAVSAAAQRLDSPTPERVATGGTASSTVQPKPDRLSSTDVDALMARLALEENQGRKSGLTRQGLYKFVLGSFAVLALLVLLT